MGVRKKKGRAVLSTGTVTTTEYPTNAINTANEIVRQSSNTMGVLPVVVVSSVITVLDVFRDKSVTVFIGRDHT